MKIQPNVTNLTSFSGHGARHIGQVMNNLYKKAYKDMPYPPDIIAVTVKLENGTEVSATANFFRGKYINLSIDNDNNSIRSAFCKAVIERYNHAVTKGKAYK